MAVFNYDKQFEKCLLEHQRKLRAFIRTLLPAPQDAEDVLQETNLVLCRKADEFVMGTNFSAWCMQVAYLQSLAHRQKQGRQRLVFDDEMVRELADMTNAQLENFDDRKEALNSCLESLSAAERQILVQRYGEDRPVHEIAADAARPSPSVRQSLYRIRSRLLGCIQRRLGAERHSP